MTIPEDVLENALEDAVKRQFSNLFSALLVDDSADGFQRFSDSLDKLHTTAEAVAAMIAKKGFGK